VRLPFHEELERVEGLVRRMGQQVTMSLDEVVVALRERDDELARAVVDRDLAIDDTHIEIERAAELLLALQAPVAHDLRLVLAASHIARHLERIGNQCATVAKLTILTAPQASNESLDSALFEMGDRTREMLSLAVDAVHRRDAGRAELLETLDERVDVLNREMVRRAVELEGDRDMREYGVLMVLVARAFERIGDNAVDIAEQAAYLVRGSSPPARG
jgi:phosphate transport system protein